MECALFSTRILWSWRDGRGIRVTNTVRLSTGAGERWRASSRGACRRSSMFTMMRVSRSRADREGLVRRDIGCCGGLAYRRSGRRVMFVWRALSLIVATLLYTGMLAGVLSCKLVL